MMLANQMMANQMMASQMMTGMGVPQGFGMPPPQFGMPQGANLRSYNPFETGSAQGVPPRPDFNRGNQPFF